MEAEVIVGLAAAGVSFGELGVQANGVTKISDGPLWLILCQVVVAAAVVSQR